ncbi:MAG TPA: cadmium-translocating P-type ATPase [Nitrospirae bacterium]|nr:putative cadmium-transporting ATPase [bacterium BMS3Abin06]HDH13000.1 cadmium-translocating P-type ATPase [Nitrospirota bacterium]HDZ02924.1 cadmium-translocating P-type ATPase [Nitrospirota bacterium]
MQKMKLQVINNTCEEEKSCSCCSGDFFEEKPESWRRRQLITGGIAGALLVSGLALEFLTPLNIIAQIVFLSVIAVSGREILKKAWLSILKRRLDMNCLIAIAAFGSFFIGHGEEGAAVVFLFFIAEALEDMAADNAKKSISRLLKLAPETAKVKRSGKEVEMHVQEIEIGDTIVIRPGEKIPLDGKVIVGHSSIDESPITGESLPVDKAEGDAVYAGTMNEEGYLEVEVGRKSGDTVLSRIVKLVEEAEKKKSKTEKFIDRFARYYTPIVIGLAFAAFLIPTFILGYPWDVWFYRALVLLVISCPCALAISTPVAMVSALTNSAKHGVLIKGATYLEELNNVRAIAFDKTGTLTKGKLEVTDIIGFNNHSENEVLSIAASMEARSEHPIAKAILKKTRNENIQLKEISGFRAIKGRGLEARIDGKTYYAGARNLFDDLSIELPEELSQFEMEGKTSIFISNEDRAIGVIALGDRVRDKAPRIISRLKKMNIRTEMITGDNKQVAASLAEKIGIDEYHAQLLPEDKVKVVEKLTARFGTIAMVGDGVNDAPALAAANVGIAMGAVGSDVAIETADIALMHDDLSRIDYLMHLSRKTMHIVKQNVAVSLLIKGSFTVLALMGLINLWVAVAIGDMGLSLAVILNAMRLTKVKAE